MGFVKRFGGWRPVESERGIGRLRASEGDVLEDVEYGFEVWHQMVDGFPGPYRAEGRVSAGSSRELDRFAGRAVALELEDGRRLEVRIDAGGRLLAHNRPVPPPDAAVETPGGSVPPATPTRNE